ncbi:helix-turn-helix transcriptional regulator [Aquabacterium sp. A7-Y]|uniref:helix-turn-helix domain-containing protein n=1 Tax=Aquabacterium sp. A7-Y TaxID=1349605 RepID=UPI00223CFEED|nr:helix-turn-helix transcriptional regulator [Aquabacterium sp. A7-Y]MCW7538425.1 helix-turn-helix transcriptional regulator [Aquabacterium sp. A7-Y]
MNCTQAFGDTVRVERRQRGLTQGDLALRAGLHLNQVSRIERGEAVPSLLTIFALADALEMGSDQLIATAMQKITTGRHSGQ